MSQPKHTNKNEQTIATSIRVTPHQNGALFEPPICTGFPHRLYWNAPAADVRFHCFRNATLAAPG